MKKFRLIKTYPGSPKLGTIYQEIEGLCPYHGKMYKNLSKKGDCLLASEVENHPEFWQEIVEKDYEILSFTCNNKKLYYNKNLKYFNYANNDCNTHRTLEFILKNPNTYKIHSVKRLSDGEIFTIDDFVNGRTISSFSVNWIEIGLKIHCDDVGKGNKNDGCFFELQDLKKSKQPLFTTEDGVDIFDYSEDFYWVKKESLRLCNRMVEKNYHSKFFIYEPENELYFSTKEAAEEYILMNKPCLSINDILSLSNSQYLNSGFKSQLETLVKSKLNK